MYDAKHRADRDFLSVLVGIVKLILFVVGMAVWLLILFVAGVFAAPFVLRLVGV